MKTADLSHASDEDLVARFRTAATRMGEAVLNSRTQETNRIYYYLRAIDLELRERGREARMELAPLLDDDNRFVRYYAAQKLLGLIPDRARPIIEWNYKHGFDAIAGDAGMLLAALDAGEYLPD